MWDVPDILPISNPIKNVYWCYFAVFSPNCQNCVGNKEEYKQALGTVPRLLKYKWLFKCCCVRTDSSRWVMVRWPPALSATSTQNTERTNCLQMSHAEGDRVCVHANCCLVFSFIVCAQLWGGRDFPLLFKLWVCGEAPNSVRTHVYAHTHTHTHTKTALCLTPDDEQAGQTGASFLGSWERQVHSNEYLCFRPACWHTLSSVQLALYIFHFHVWHIAMSVILPLFLSAFVVINPTPCLDTGLYMLTCMLNTHLAWSLLRGYSDILG